MPIPTGKFVVGEGPTPAMVMLLGRNPGGKEAKVGLPFCLVEDTLVLRADLQWVPIITLNVGDQIITLSENPEFNGKGVSGHQARKWELATVTAKLVKEALCIKVHTNDGELIGTGDHKVLAAPVRKLGKIDSFWTTIYDLKPHAKEKRHLHHGLVKLFEPWVRSDTRTAGWLAGLLDGEGSIKGSKLKTKHKRNRLEVSLSQNLGPVMDAALAAIKFLGFTPKQYRKMCSKKYPKSTCHSLNISGTVPDKMRFLGTVAPVRLLVDYLRVLQARVYRTQLKREHVRPVLYKEGIGFRKVVDIKTTSGTFLANGFFVHNCGPAGEELSMYCTHAGVERNACYVTNLFKYYTPADESPLESQYDHHFPITQRELLLTKPKVLVTLGGECTGYMMKKFGINFRGMDAMHGVPLLAQHNATYADKPEEPFDPYANQWISALWGKSAESGLVDTILFPAGHPASGLHKASAMTTVSYDFYELASLLHGKIKPRDPHAPQHPMVRRLVTSPEDVAQIFKSCGGLCGLDTEGMPDYPWGLTFSVTEWEGYCILATQKDCIEEFKRQIAKMIANGGQLIIHNCLHDLGVLEAMDIWLPDGSYVDTMVMSYLLGNMPQGLKPLSYRFWDIKMQDYMDVVEPYERAKVLDYLQTAGGYDWDACPICEAYRANGKAHPVGGYEKIPVEHRTKDGKHLRKKFANLYTMCNAPVPETPDRRHTISRRIERLLKDFETGAIVEMEDNLGGEEDDGEAETIQIQR